MIELRQNTTAVIWVRLTDSTGAPVVGALYSDVTATVWKNNNTTSTLTLAISDWSEVTAGAFSGTGTYILTIPSTALDQLGRFMYAVKTATSSVFIGALKIIANEEAETKAVVDLLQKYSEGRWKIFTSGADAYRLVLYDIDGITPLKKFNLFDKFGNPVTSAPYERVPV